MAPPPTAGQLPSVGAPQFNNLPNTNAGAAVTSATASTLTPGGSVTVAVKNGSGAQIKFTDSATGQVSVIGTIGSTYTSNVNGTNVTSGNLYQGYNNPNQLSAGVAAAGTINPRASTLTGATQAIQTTVPSASDTQDANDQTAGILSSQLSVTTLSNATDAPGHLNAFLSTTA
ncbi:MAG TPA: hypothetical protein VGP41_11435 [Candidatus Lustribacter sp.]|nr:hypothetical protein [Candidatus Lustribacter sp.]